MLSCRKCDYGIGSDLKYSLINNVCPVCGASLFGDKEMQEIKDIGLRIRTEEFSHSMSDVLIYDISLFVYSKYLRDEGLEAARFAESASTGEEVLDSSKAEEEYALTESEIREEVRGEYIEELDDDSHLGAEDDDFKVARLKRLAKESMLSGKTGAKVSRVDASK